VARRVNDCNRLLIACGPLPKLGNNPAFAAVLLFAG
jgi:hypothetical protein